MVDYGEIAAKWLIRLVLIYFILNLLETMLDWKVWIIIVIGVLGVFLIIDKILEIRMSKKPARVVLG